MTSTSVGHEDRTTNFKKCFATGMWSPPRLGRSLTQPAINFEPARSFAASLFRHKRPIIEFGEKVCAYPSVRRFMIQLFRVLVSVVNLSLVVLATVATSFAEPALPGDGQRLDGPPVYGPIVTWDDDPTTTMRVTWVEGEPAYVGQRVASSPLWREGMAGFGYGDGDDRTILTDMRGKYRRVYARHGFKLSQVARSDRAKLRIRYDDGFIAYLNGVEFARRGIEKGSGKRAEEIKSHEATIGTYRTIDIQDWKRLARKGSNLLAIEGHNTKKSSSDFTLDAYLTLNGRNLIQRHDQWAFLAGRDPGPNWTDPEYHPFERNRRRPVAPAQKKFDDVVYYRRAGAVTDWQAASGTHRFFGDTEDIVRSVSISNLLPATEYEFVIGETPSTSHRRNGLLRFRTAPRARPYRYSFVAGGDMGASDIARKMNRLAGSLDPVFALLGGDLAYANGKDLAAWHNWLNAWRENAITADGRLIPMVVAIGNHEMGSKLSQARATQLGVPRNSQFFFSLFTLPTGKTHYTLTFGDYMSVIVLDSNHFRKVAGRQTTWLKNALQTTERYPFRFVCSHRPAYGTAKDPDESIREHWVPLFEEYQPTVVFENDHHTLKRTHRIREGKVADDGVLYLGDGAWGVETRDVPKPGGRWYLANAAKENHLWNVTIAGDEVTCQALDENGEELDAVQVPGR